MVDNGILYNFEELEVKFAPTFKLMRGERQEYNVCRNSESDSSCSQSDLLPGLIESYIEALKVSLLSNL